MNKIIIIVFAILLIFTISCTNYSPNYAFPTPIYTGTVDCYKIALTPNNDSVCFSSGKYFEAYNISLVTCDGKVEREPKLLQKNETYSLMYGDQSIYYLVPKCFALTPKDDNCNCK
jgi:hypothetical protein